MKSIETRRISRVAQLAAVLVGILFLFEIVMLCGIVDLKSDWVAKNAPWAYEPFLRLTGEHPQQREAAAPEQEVPASPVSEIVVPVETPKVEAEPAEEADDDIPVG